MPENFPAGLKYFPCPHIRKERHHQIRKRIELPGFPKLKMDDAHAGACHPTGIAFLIK